MRNLNISEFSRWPLEEVVAVYLKHFRWLSGEQREVLRRAVIFGQTCEPAVDKYYWASIPRIVVSISMYLNWLTTVTDLEKTQVLDFGTCQPIAALWHLAVPGMASRADFTYSAMATECYFEKSDLGTFAAESVVAPFDGGRLPFVGYRFDAVIFNEVLEHLDQHPQLALCEINRILKIGGSLLISTPNAASWKKIYKLSNGDWNYDSPTFLDVWGHRYEYSYYQVNAMLRRSGFSIVQERVVDVYFDDPRGYRSTTQLASIVLSKMLSGDFKSAARLWLRRGSGLFFVARKIADVGSPSGFDLMAI